MRLLVEWSAFVDRADDVSKALATVERRKRKGEVTDRERAVARMAELIDGSPAIKSAAKSIDIELGRRWLQEFDTYLNRSSTIARHEGRRRGGATALAVHRIQQHEKRSERVRREALLALVARPMLSSSDFELIYRPAAAVVPLGRINGWGVYGPNTDLVETILDRLGRMRLEDWMAVAAVKYRLTKESDTDYGAAISSIRILSLFQQFDKRDREVATANEATSKLLEAVWTPPDTRTGWQWFSGDRSQESIWKWRKASASEAGSLLMAAAVDADRLPPKTFVSASRPFRTLSDLSAS